MRLQARSVRRLVCEFDELSHDLLHNQILKASLRRLARAPMIDRELARELQLTALRMGSVADIRLERSAFARVQLHRNNAYSDLVLKVAELAFDCLLPDPASGTYRFHDILRDEAKMPKVFEDFVFNFYAAQQRECRVLPLTISWDAVPLWVTGAGRLPAMITDVYLRSASRRIILDTKYYTSSLQKSQYGRESYHSGNLYQLFAYLKNAAGRDPNFQGCEGVLLYPQVQGSLRDTYLIQGHPVTLATIDLARPWHEISKSLLALLGPPDLR